VFRLNRLTDYAVVVLTQMAQAPARTISAQQVATGTALPLPTVSKLLSMLSKQGLIASQRGAAGGYSLSRDASEITVAAIIEAIEGPIALTACADGSSDACEVESLCPMAGNWNRVNGAIRTALTQVTLAEMANAPPPPALRERASAPRPAAS